MKNILTTLILYFTLIGWAQAQDVVLKSNDKHLHYMGRVDMQANRAVLSWSGSSVKFNFKGTGARALLQDEAGNNFYNVIVDGQISQKIQLDREKHLYTLAANLPVGKHTIELFKLTEWAMGKTWFYEFQLDAKAKVLSAPATKKRKIEFFGNSITCGYAVLDSSGQDRGTAPFEDNYKSYAAITARHFNADYNCTAKSGIGITVSFGPEIMPEMYNRLYGNDSTSKWDFSKFTPDVVVINQFQNDAALVNLPNHEQFKARFGNAAPAPEFIIGAYQNFVQTIRRTYPKAYIICALGNMTASKEGSVWPGYIKEAVKNINDKRIVSLIFPYKNSYGHPGIKDQQAMAKDLIAYIEKNVKW
jgi:lysophospholipase L1-like esterase